MSTEARKEVEKVLMVDDADIIAEMSLEGLTDWQLSMEKPVHVEPKQKARHPAFIVEDDDSITTI